MHGDLELLRATGEKNSYEGYLNCCQKSLELLKILIKYSHCNHMQVKLFCLLHCTNSFSSCLHSIWLVHFCQRNISALFVHTKYSTLTDLWLKHPGCILISYVETTHTQLKIQQLIIRQIFCY